MPDNYSIATNLVEISLRGILENSPRKVEFADSILDIVRALDEQNQRLLAELRKLQGE